MLKRIPQFYHDLLPVDGRQSPLPLFRDSSQGQGGGGVLGGGQSDPNFADVALLVDFDGVDGGTTATDLSGEGRTLTFQNSVTLSDLQSPFGTTSLHTEGALDGRVAVTPQFNINQDWTLEGFVYVPDVIFSAGQGFIIDIGSDLAVKVATNLTNAFLSTDGNAGNHTISSTVPIPIGSWWHWAATRKNDDFHLWQEGVNVGTPALNDPPINWGGTPSHTVIGDQVAAGDRSFPGFIGPTRFTAGARYTANFTPPTEMFPTS